MTGNQFYLRQLMIKELWRVFAVDILPEELSREGRGLAYPLAIESSVQSLRDRSGTSLNHFLCRHTRIPPP